MTELLPHLETVALVVFLVSSMAAMGLTLTLPGSSGDLADSLAVFAVPKAHWTKVQ